MENVNRVIELHRKGVINTNKALKIIESEKNNITNNDFYMANALISFQSGNLGYALGWIENISITYNDYNKVLSLIYFISLSKNNINYIEKYKEYAFKYSFDEIAVIRKWFYDQKIDTHNAVRLLLSLKNNNKINENLLYATIAEIEYESKQYLNAKRDASRIDEKDNCKKNYYILFKTNLMLDNIEEAKEDFYKFYDENNIKNNFIDSVFNYLDGNDKKYEEYDYYGLTKKQKEIFYKLVNSFYNENFNECELYLNKIEEFNNQYVDLKPLRVLIEKCKDKALNNVYTDLYKAYEEKNLDEVYKLLIKISKNSKISKRMIVYKCLLLLIKNGKYDVDSIFKEIPDFESEKEERNIVSNAINYNNNVDRNNKQYSEYIILKNDYILSKAIVEDDLEAINEAHDLYTSAYFITQEPLLIYYLAQMYYLRGVKYYRKYDYRKAVDCLETSLEYFNQYKNEGYEKVNMCYLHIYKIYDILYFIGRQHSDHKKMDINLRITKSLNELYDTIDIGYVQKYAKRIKMTEESFTKQ